MNHEHIASFKSGNLGVALVTPTAGGRGTARIELSVYGARYPYKLSAAEARELAHTLETVAEQLEQQSRRPTDAGSSPAASRARPASTSGSHQATVPRSSTFSQP